MLTISELRAGLAIQSYSFVGRVRLDDLTITIIPKLKHSSLLNLLRYAYGFRRLRLLTESSHWFEDTGFQDLLVAQLNAEVTELMARGLHRSYLRKREGLSAPRGKIDIQEVVNNGGVLTACLPCVHHPRVEDCLLNQVLLAGVRLAATVAIDLQLRRSARRLAAFLEDGVSPLRLDAQVLARLKRSMNRLTTAYSSAVSLIALLYSSQHISFQGTESPVQLSGFLFDMNRFFQALLSRFLGENLDGFRLYDEHRLRGVFNYTLGYGRPGTRPPTPRPDFVILDRSQTVAIADAKYRDLWGKSLPEKWLYQLAIYAMSYDRGRATILYPTTDLSAREVRIDVTDPIHGGSRAQVQLRPVVLDKLEGLVMAMPSAAVGRERRAYAKLLVFGA